MSTDEDTLHFQVWDRLADPGWYEVHSPEEVKHRLEDVRTWPSVWGVKGVIFDDVFKAMNQQSTLWPQLLATGVLTELGRRQHLSVSEEDLEGKEGWLADFLDQSRARKARQEDAEKKRFRMAKDLMGPGSPATYHAQQFEGGPAPVWDGCPASVALLTTSIDWLLEPFRRGGGETRKIQPQHRALERARRVRGLVRWVSKDLQGDDRAAGLTMGWAVGVWLRDHQFRDHPPNLQEDARGHAQTIMGLAVKEMEKTGRSLLEGAVLALDGRFGPEMTARVAHALALSVGPAWQGIQADVWARSMGALEEAQGENWCHADDLGASPERRYLRSSTLAAAANHLAIDTLPLSGDVLGHLKKTLRPGSVTELLGQVWCSVQSQEKEEHLAAWKKVCHEWLMAAPDQRGRWPQAVRNAHRSENLLWPEDRLAAQAKEWVVELGWSQPTLATRKPRL